MARFSLDDLLSLFASNDLGQALVRAGLSGGGSKNERVESLRLAAIRGGATARQVLSYFSAESLRRLATRLRVEATSKDAYAAGLAALLTEQFPPVAPTVATTESIRDFVASLSGSLRLVASEADAEWFLASALSERFSDVRRQAPVPGQFWHRIDIDIQNGRFGVEVKLASAIMESSSEAYRLLGQAIYYDRRRYGGRLLVVIVGQEALRQNPTLVEIRELLGALGVAVQYVAVFAG